MTAPLSRKEAPAAPYPPPPLPLPPQTYHPAGDPETFAEKLGLLSGYDEVVAFDSEFVPDDELGLILQPKSARPRQKSEKPRKPLGLRPDGSIKANAVICHSVCVVDPCTGQGFTDVYYMPAPAKEYRITMTRLIHNVVKEMYARRMHDLLPGPNGVELKILLVGHFTRADLPGFRDWAKLKKHDSVRGTYATVTKAFTFEVPLGGLGRAIVTAPLRDTILSAPDGYKSLSKLGDALGVKKLTVPEVIDERGRKVPGIGRMDLVLQQDPVAFDAYARQDAVVTMEAILDYHRWLHDLEVAKSTITIGQTAVELLIKQQGGKHEDLAATLGVALGSRGNFSTKKWQLRPRMAAAKTSTADAYHGGRNECYTVGRFTAPHHGAFYDHDLKGAYVAIFAFFRPGADDRIAETRERSLLIQVDYPAVAHVEFSFPPSSPLPCLPVRADHLGLCFPLRGRSYASAPELLVAKNLGAKITPLSGWIFPWRDDHSPSPFISFAERINELRAHYKGSPDEHGVPRHHNQVDLLSEQRTKTAGNALYGKCAQSVAGMKTPPPGQATAKPRNVPNTRIGEYEPIKPSKITSPLIATYCSGFTRAVVSEIAADLLKRGFKVFSITTDGFITDASLADVQPSLQGPVTRKFAELRGLVDALKSTDVLETKHTAAEIVMIKTRGAVSTIPIGNKWIVAQCGHKIPGEGHTDAERVEFLLDERAKRDHTSKLKRRDLISILEQWQEDADLIGEERSPSVSMDFDFKQCPIIWDDVVEVDSKGVRHTLLRISKTRPWATVDKFIQARRDLERWYIERKRCLKTTADLDDFMAYRASRVAIRRSAQGQGSGGRSPWMQHLVVACAKALLSSSTSPRPSGATRHTRASLTTLLLAAGVPVTRKVLEHARARFKTLPALWPKRTPADRAVAKALKARLKGLITLG